MHDPHHLLRVTLLSIRDAVVIADSAASVLMMNPAAEAMTGWAESDAIGKPLAEVIDLRENGTDLPVLNPVHAVLRETARVEPAGHSLLVSKGGQRVAVTITASPLRNPEGALVGAVLALHDVSESVQLSVQLAKGISYQAQHDPLTGLPNRILLVDRLEQATKLADRNNHLVALLFLYLDRFSEIADHQHAVADELLKEVASRLTANLRESDTVSRLGPGEFVVMLPGLRSLADLQNLAAKLVAEVALPFALSLPGQGKETSRQIQTTASIGISIYPRHGSDATTLMRLADSAMQLARQAGGNQAQFAPSAHQETEEPSTLVEQPDTF